MEIKTGRSLTVYHGGQNRLNLWTNLLPIRWWETKIKPKILLLLPPSGILRSNSSLKTKLNRKVGGGKERLRTPSHLGKFSNEQVQIWWHTASGLNQLSATEKPVQSRSSNYSQAFLSNHKTPSRGSSEKWGQKQARDKAEIDTCYPVRKEKFSIWKVLEGNELSTLPTEKLERCGQLRNLCLWFLC